MHSRRKILNLAAGLLGTTRMPSVLSAATEDAGIAAPRVALVIGNSDYSSTPLENPVNDATAISKALSDLGFQCQLLINARLEDMASAVQSHGEHLARLKAVGLFYYAGHGAQLAWRNYLVPVDAAISSLEDLPKKSLELNSVLTTLKKAANPMNVIILDACRDNPFGSRVPLEQKGLSQFDAPNGSLLSYATAPGNTASDGEGVNGLFTENLLREMRVPGAKLEEVFKRVRLQVRLKSKGQQIPWESTSLEQDFYFTRTAEQMVKLSDEQKEALFTKEQGLWNVVKDSGAHELFSTYLTLYPNGSYSQLAQVQLDRLLKRQGEKKVELAAANSNPFTKGTTSVTGRFHVGDRYTFEQREAISNVVEKTYTHEVSKVTDLQVVFNDGELILDSIGNEIKSQANLFPISAQIFPAEYSVGSKWNTTFPYKTGDGVPSTLTLELKVIERQQLITSVGSFNAFKVIGGGRVVGGQNFEISYWIDPDKCLRPVQFNVIARSRRYAFLVASKTTLVEFFQNSPMN
jgi:hypothetical protein